MSSAPAPSCLVVAERRSKPPLGLSRRSLGAMGLAPALIPGKDLERLAAKRVASMIDTARRSWQEVVMLGLLLACEASRAPSSADPSVEVPSPPAPGAASSEAVLPASDQRSAAGAAALVPGGGGAPTGLNGVGGNAPRPAGSGASGMGGNDTGSGGASGGGASGSSGASGRDADPSSDEERYALWLAPARAADERDDVQRPGD